MTEDTNQNTLGQTQLDDVSTAGNGDTENAGDSHENDESGDDGSSPSTSSTSKVAKGIEKYGLEGLNDRIRYQYVHEDKSLRDLEQVVNEAFVEAALKEADDIGFVEPKRIVDVLKENDENMTTKDISDFRESLEKSGLDVDRLESDLITYVTLGKHLKEHLDVDTSRKSTITTESGESTIEWIRTRCDKIVTQTLKRLQKENLVNLGSDFVVSTDIIVTCDECGVSREVWTILTTGCDCSGSDS